MNYNQLTKTFLIFLLTFTLIFTEQTVNSSNLKGDNKKLTAQNSSQDLEEEEVKRVARESQLAECLTIYTNPTTFDKKLLTKYWLPIDKGGEAILDVLASVQRLKKNRWHYGKDSENQEFTIRNVRIFPPGDMAEVRTFERWYLPLVDDQERRVKNKSNPIIEFPVTYTLVKIEGKWLIHSSTAIYAKD